MATLAPVACIPDEGIAARIPDSPLSVLTLIEVRNRIASDPGGGPVTADALSRYLNIPVADVYAALAYYHANQLAFDAELQRRRRASSAALKNIFRQGEKTSGWDIIVGRWPGKESEEEVNAALERMS